MGIASMDKKTEQRLLQKILTFINSVDERLTVLERRADRVEMQKDFQRMEAPESKRDIN